MRPPKFGSPLLQSKQNETRIVGLPLFSKSLKLVFMDHCADGCSVLVSNLHLRLRSILKQFLDGVSVNEADSCLLQSGLVPSPHRRTCCRPRTRFWW